MSCLTSPSGTDGIPSLLLKMSQISKVNQDPDDLNGLLIARKLEREAVKYFFRLCGGIQKVWDKSGHIRALAESRA